MYAELNSSVHGAARVRLATLLQTQQTLKALLSYRDWSLLRWTNRRLRQLADQEGISEFNSCVAYSPDYCSFWSCHTHAVRLSKLMDFCGLVTICM